MDSVTTPAVVPIVESAEVDNSITQLYNRQASFIPDLSNKPLLLIGAGGIGAWGGLYAALMGIKIIIMFDPDKIEMTNLNRTPFTQDQIGEYKTLALKKLIHERRPDCMITTIEDYFGPSDLEEYKDCYILDCTDTLKTRGLLENFKGSFIDYVKLGYDGFEGTIVHNDFASGAWGDDSSYTTVPSYFGTPVIMATLGLNCLFLKSEIKNKTKNVNVNEIVK